LAPGSSGRRKNGRIEVRIEPFARQPPPRVREGAAEEAERLAAFLQGRFDRFAFAG
jgi:hypothetical protein